MLLCQVPISLLVERQGATNLALGNNTLATPETVTLTGTGDWTIQSSGDAVIAVTAGTATITGAGNATAAAPLTINCTATGTIILTKSSGTLLSCNNLAIKQVEAGSVATSWIPTTTTPGEQNV